MDFHGLQRKFSWFRRLASRYHGQFRESQWFTPLEVTLQSVDGPFSRRWDHALLDTGASVHVLPGTCASIKSNEDARIPSHLEVDLRMPPGNGGSQTPVYETNYLPVHDLTKEPIRGVESAGLRRFMFWAAFSGCHIPTLDLATVIFMDIDYPILSVGECVKNGICFEFGDHGFRAW